MYVAPQRRFKNEYGNTIAMNGIMREGTAGICEHVTYAISGPESKTTNTVTVKEAEMLRDLLIELVGTP